MPSNRRLLSPPGRTGSLARGSYNFRKRSLRRSRCEHGGVAITTDLYFHNCYGIFGGRNEANRRGFIQIGPRKLLKGAPTDDFFFELRDVALQISLV